MNGKIKAFLKAVVFFTAASSCQADEVLKDIQGNQISLSSLKGKWVLINYWAGWCQTCIDEIPNLNRFYRKHIKDPIVLFGVNYDGLPLYKQKKLSKNFNIEYPSLANDPALAFGLEHILGVPVTFIINPQGKLINTLYGGQNVHSLDRAIKES